MKKRRKKTKLKLRKYLTKKNITIFAVVMVVLIPTGLIINKHRLNKLIKPNLDNNSSLMEPYWTIIGTEDDGRPRIGDDKETAHDNFSGSWQTNFGTMNISQKGSEVIGVYFDGPANASGTVDGKVVGSVFVGNWHLNGASGPLSLVKNGSVFDGFYRPSKKSATDIKWCGSKNGVQFAPGCGFAGDWQVSVNGISCKMTITRTDLSVVGNFCNNRYLIGNVTYGVGYVLVSGSWHTDGELGSIKLFMAKPSDSPKQLYFQGNYNDGAHGICGGVSPNDLPQFCFKN